MLFLSDFEVLQPLRKIQRPWLIVRPLGIQDNLAPLTVLGLAGRGDEGKLGQPWERGEAVPYALQ